MSTEPDYPDLIVTDYFRAPVWATVRRAATPGARLGVMALALLPLVLLAVGAAFHDLRWVLIAFIVMTLLVPMTLLIFFYYFALKPEVSIQKLPHRLIIRTGEWVRVEFLPDDILRVPSDFTIPWRDVLYLRDCRDYWLLSFRRSASPASS